MSLPQAVANIGKINISGNVIPAVWWKRILTHTGKPDAVGVVILSEIIYWYRPREVRDEDSGLVLGIEKRFKNDRLQRSYQSFADQFGYSKELVKEAIDRLVITGLLIREFRHLPGLANAVHLEPIPRAIRDLCDPRATFNTYPNILGGMGEKSGDGGGKKTVDHPPENHPPIPQEKGGTYTEIKEITTETKTSIGPKPAQQVAANSEYSQDFEDAWAVYPKRAGGNPKRSAYKAWNGRIKAGESAQSMLDGVLRYAAFIQATGKAGTEYVKQAATFFGPDRHYLELWEIAGVGCSRSGRPSPHVLPTPGSYGPSSALPAGFDPNSKEAQDAIAY